MAVNVDYEYYRETYGGTLTRTAFEGSVAAAEQQVGWLTDGRRPHGACERTALKRAVCAAVDVLAEYGRGNVGGFAIGDFRMTQFEGRGAATGDALASEAIMRELAGTALAFSGVR